MTWKELKEFVNKLDEKKLEEKVVLLIKNEIIKFKVKKPIVERLFDREPAMWFGKRIYSTINFYCYDDEIESVVSVQLNYFDNKSNDGKVGLSTIWLSKEDIETSYANGILTFNND